MIEGRGATRRFKSGHQSLPMVRATMINCVLLASNRLQITADVDDKGLEKLEQMLVHLVVRP